MREIAIILIVDAHTVEAASISDDEEFVEIVPRPSTPPLSTVIRNRQARMTPNAVQRRIPSSSGRSVPVRRVVVAIPPALR